MRTSRRAFALIFVLGMLAVMAMLMGALFASVLGPAAQSKTVTRQISGLYVAEAGLQDALQQLQDLRSWTAGFNKQSTIGGVGTYTIKFPAAPPYTRWDSVNNLMGSAPVDSYRGPLTVPKGTVLIVVEARVDGTVQRLEALLGEGAELPTGTALLAGGEISMIGDVRVGGIKSFSDATPIQADIHSNDSRNRSNLVTWSGGSATIQGNVSSVGPNPVAINLGTATVTGTTTVGAATRKFPNFNIVSSIASKSSKPAPSINPTGPTSLASGDYYHAGDLTVNGDLDLQDARVYVSGKVVINGSLRGKGSLYVGGSTRLQGDSNIVAQESQSIALMSEGDVTLDGFDGNAYFNSIAATDPTFAARWNQAKTTVQDLQTDVASLPLATWDHADMQNYIHVLGPYATFTPVHNGFESGLMGKMAATLNTQAPSPTRDFLVERLISIEHLFKGGGGYYGSDRNALNKFYATGDVGALFDASVDEQETAAWGAVQNVINSLDYNHLGSSYFQGVIYSNGNVQANHDLTILGALFAQGQVSLNSGVTLTYVQKLFEAGGVMANSGQVTIMSWLGP